MKKLIKIFTIILSINLINGAEVTKTLNLNQELAKLLSRGLEESDIEQVKKLIDAKANVDIFGPNLCETALHNAVMFKNRDFFDYLLKKGADTRVQNLFNATPLHFLMILVPDFLESETETLFYMLNKLIRSNKATLFEKDHYSKFFFYLVDGISHPLPKTVFLLIDEYAIDKFDLCNFDYVTRKRTAFYLLLEHHLSGNVKLALWYILCLDILTEDEKKQILASVGEANINNAWHNLDKGTDLIRSLDSEKISTFNNMELAQQIKFLSDFI